MEKLSIEELSSKIRKYNKLYGETQFHFNIKLKTLKKLPTEHTVMFLENFEKDKEEIDKIKKLYALKQKENKEAYRILSNKKRVTETYTCQVCNRLLKKQNWKLHEATAKHIENKKKGTPILSTPRCSCGWCGDK